MPAFEGMDVEELYPVQELAVKGGLLSSERNFVVAAPTASGKTLVAFMFIASILSRRPSGKVAYLVPLKSLAEEKFTELRSFEGVTKSDGEGFSVGLSTGDYDSPGGELRRYDIVVLTNEKFDSLIRHKAGWLDDLSGVVVDEVHNISDPTRGPVLEYTLTMSMDMGARILALSATISNANEIAGWLNAILVTSSWRPVPLREGAYHGGIVECSDGGRRSLNVETGNPVIDLVLDSLSDDGQVLIFNETRRRAAKMAKEVAPHVARFLGRDDLRELAGLSKYLSSESKTHPEEELAKLVLSGVAYHHAGLGSKFRRKIEAAFRDGMLKVLSSTTTLAAGVNLPARRVIITSLTRYNQAKARRVPISVMEYKQMAGRAGRPQYDDHGEAIIIAKSWREARDVLPLYILSDPEPIRSRLGDVDVLESLVLAYLTSRPSSSIRIREFMMSTLLGSQERKRRIVELVDIALDRLKGHDLILARGRRLTPTKLGARISQLYIKPRTAFVFLDVFKELSPENTILALLPASTSPDFEPKYPGRESMLLDIMSLMPRPAGQLMETLLEYSWEYSGRSLLALLYWINEFSEHEIYDRVGVESGDLHRMTSNMEWILYAYSELAKLMKFPSLSTALRRLQLRVKHGIKEDLLDLVVIPGVGRVRARSLYNGGFRTIGDIAGVSPEELARIGGFGGKLASRMVEEARRIFRRSSRGR